MRYMFILCSCCWISSLLFSPFPCVVDALRVCDMFFFSKKRKERDVKCETILKQVNMSWEVRNVYDVRRSKGGGRESPWTFPSLSRPSLRSQPLVICSPGFKLRIRTFIWIGIRCRVSHFEIYVCCSCSQFRSCFADAKLMNGILLCLFVCSSVET